MAGPQRGPRGRAPSAASETQGPSPIRPASAVNSQRLFPHLDGGDPSPGPHPDCSLRDPGLRTQLSGARTPDAQELGRHKRELSSAAGLRQGCRAAWRPHGRALPPFPPPAPSSWTLTAASHEAKSPWRPADARGGVPRRTARSDCLGVLVSPDFGTNAPRAPPPFWVTDCPFSRGRPVLRVDSLPTSHGECTVGGEPSVLLCWGSTRWGLPHSLRGGRSGSSGAPGARRGRGRLQWGRCEPRPGRRVQALTTEETAYPGAVWAEGRAAPELGPVTARDGSPALSLRCLCGCCVPLTAGLALSSLPAPPSGCRAREGPDGPRTGGGPVTPPGPARRG